MSHALLAILAALVVVGVALAGCSSGHGNALLERGPLRLGLAGRMALDETGRPRKG